VHQLGPVAPSSLQLNLLTVATAGWKSANAGSKIYEL